MLCVHSELLELAIGSQVSIESILFNSGALLILDDGCWVTDVQFPLHSSVQQARLIRYGWYAEGSTPV